MASSLSKVTVLKCVFMDSRFFFGLRCFCLLAPRGASSLKLRATILKVFKATSLKFGDTFLKF